MASSVILYTVLTYDVRNVIELELLVVVILEWLKLWENISLCADSMCALHR